MSERLRVGVLPLARSTFDVDFAEETAAAAYAALDGEVEVVGARDLLFDADSTRAAASAMAGEAVDLLLVMQVTFTDAALTVAIGDELQGPLALWAFPEERTGGRLRLNSFCGINLAAHALTRAGRAYGYLYRDPEASGLGAALAKLVRDGHASGSRPRPPGAVDARAAARAGDIRRRLAATRVGVVGDHPDGFTPCEYDPGALAELTGVTVQRLELSDLFTAALAVPEAEVAEVRSRVETTLEGADRVDGEALNKTLRLYSSLKHIAHEADLAGLAVRCWPECFTEYGSANCGAAALLNDERLPTACEADVYGNVTALVLQWLGDGPALVADLVDVDVADNSGVFWHCGKAPPGMADPDVTPVATVHSNRRLPLLYEFPLKPGRVTIARLSTAGGRHTMVIGGGEMVRAPISFSGTSGVLRFDGDAARLVDTVMEQGLEHHYGLVYGDVRPELEALAAELGLPVLSLD